MTVTVSVVIPVGPGHEYVAARAIQSAQQQTYPVSVITVSDANGFGAGWARNQGIAQVNTDWMIFLDADDWLEPDAVAAMMDTAAKHPGRYVYADWYRDAEIMETPKTGYAWCGGSWHPVTALLPTKWVRDVGGFDESLAGGEDTDLYLNLTTGGRCGVRLAHPILHYSADGQRGFKFVNRPDFEDVMRSIRERYKDRGLYMGCCGKTTEQNTDPVGTKQDGDVLAVALWGGNRQYLGKATGRRYGRLGNHKTFWADPRDINADRSGLQTAPDNSTPTAHGLDALAAQFGGHMQRVARRPQRGMVKYAPTPEQIAAPNIDRIIQMGIEAINA